MWGRRGSHGLSCPREKAWRPAATRPPGTEHHRCQKGRSFLAVAPWSRRTPVRQLPEEKIKETRGSLVQEAFLETLFWSLRCVIFDVSYAGFPLLLDFLGVLCQVLSLVNAGCFLTARRPCFFNVSWLNCDLACVSASFFLSPSWLLHPMHTPEIRPLLPVSFSILFFLRACTIKRLLHLNWFSCLLRSQDLVLGALIQFRKPGSNEEHSL